MILIIDTNIIFAALIKDSKTREILIDSPFILYAPETMLLEIRNNMGIILKKSGLTIEDFEILFGLLTENINIIEKEKYLSKINEANILIGNIDKGDVPFFSTCINNTQ